MEAPSFPNPECLSATRVPAHRTGFFLRYRRYTPCAGAKAVQGWSFVHRNIILGSRMVHRLRRFRENSWGKAERLVASGSLPFARCNRLGVHAAAAATSECPQAARQRGQPDARVTTRYLRR